MSLFLIYFEIGKPVPPSPVPPALQSSPIPVTFKGRSSSPRQGVLLTDGHDSGRFLAFGRGGLSVEGETLRMSLFKFIRQRLDAGARPHLVFLIFRGLVEAASIDIEHVARVPISALEERLRAMDRLPITDSTEIVEVTADTEGDDVLVQPATPSHVLVDISSENAATERDPMCWTGNIDVLISETLFGLGPSRGSLLLLPSTRALAEAIGRLREGARAVATTLTGDTASLRFVRRTSGGVFRTVVAYRGTKSVPVPVPDLDMACGDAVRRFLNSVRPERYAQINREQVAKAMDAISATWPNAVPQHMSWK